MSDRNRYLVVKSTAGNRVRLKSDIFRTPANISTIQNEFGSDLFDFRENLPAKSIIFKYDIDRLSLDEIIERINTLFQIAQPKEIAMSGAVCSSLEGCNSCAVNKQDGKSWTRKLVEFGLLSAYSIYLFVAENILGITIVATPLSLVALVSIVAAIPLLKSSWEDAKQGKFTLETFMSGTLMLAILFGEATAAFEIIYILRGGLLLEEYIATKSKNEIHKLIEIDVKKAFILIDDVELEVDMSDIVYGDIVVSRSGEKIPVDGVIIDGEATINEALINGRSESVLKGDGDKVFAGTLCERGRIYTKVTATGSGTYISRVMSDVERSLAQKSPAELEADRLASKLLKLGSFLTVGTFLVTGSLLNAFSVMIVMSCPCATVLAASTAISAGIANGAKQGILIKGGEPLEKVSQSEVFCFDKTGTLTTGKPEVTAIYTVEEFPEDKLIHYAAVAEYRNTHPIAVSILECAKERSIDIEQEAESEVFAGLGVKTVFVDELIMVGNKKFFGNHKISTKFFDDKAGKHMDAGESIFYVAVDKKLLGMIVLNHEVRPGTKKMIEDLREKGVKHIALISGDEERVANAFALEFGFDSVFANQSPYEKSEAIEALKKRYKNVVMVGDGVNDTLAMSKADVAVSFAAGGSEAAIEVSDIAITHSHPEDVANLYDLSRKSLKVVNQNYWIGTSTNLIGVGFASVGMLSPAAAGAIHIGHTVAIMANSSRLAFDKNHKIGEEL